MLTYFLGLVHIHALISYSFNVLSIQISPIREDMASNLHHVTNNLFVTQYSRAMDDEFDDNMNLVQLQKSLGIQTKIANPLTAITAGFLEPIMSIMNIYVVVIREMFFITTWRGMM